MVIVVCPWKESLTSDGQQFHQHQYNEQSPLTEHTNRPRLITLKKNSLAWDRHKSVAGLNRRIRTIVHQTNDCTSKWLWLKSIPSTYSSFEYDLLAIQVNIAAMFCFVYCCLSFSLANVFLSVLRYANSYYPFGIFKLFFDQNMMKRWIVSKFFYSPFVQKSKRIIQNSKFEIRDSIFEVRDSKIQYIKPNQSIERF